jgi:hypothetical protein
MTSIAKMENLESTFTRLIIIVVTYIFTSTASRGQNKSKFKSSIKISCAYEKASKSGKSNTLHLVQFTILFKLLKHSDATKSKYFNISVLKKAKIIATK